jgi:hypothetical protein
MDNEGNPRRNGPTGNELGRAVTRQERASPPPLPGEKDNDYWERMNRDFPVTHDPSAPLWATPNTMDGGQTSRGGKRKGELLLGGQVRQWPTASAVPYGNNRGGGAGRVGPVRPSLAARLWPTATGEDSRASGAAAYSTESGRHPGTTLTDAANGLWASPQARDWKDSGPTQGNRKSPNLGTQTWATPQSFDANDCHRSAEALARAKTKRGCANLREQVQPGLLDQGSHSTSGKRRGWPTAQAHDGLSGGRSAHAEAADRHYKPHDLQNAANQEGFSEETLRAAVRMSLSPAWVSQLMGFPTGWLAASPPVTAAKPSRRSGTRSSRRVPK